MEMEHNINELVRGHDWLPQIIKQAFEFALIPKNRVQYNTLEESFIRFIKANSPKHQIKIPIDYHFDDYEGKEAYVAGYELFPEHPVNGANDDLKRGWVAAKTDFYNSIAKFNTSKVLRQEVA